MASMGEAGVLLDAEERVVHPAIAWHDARGADEARRIAAELGEERFSERTGLPASPLCTLAKLRWLVDHHPPARAARRWLNVGEWVVRRLGGADVAELSLSSRTGLLDLAAKAPFADALAWAGLPDDLLPELVLAGTPAGAADGGALSQARAPPSPSPATTTSAPAPGWGSSLPATCSTPAGRPRRSSEWSRHRWGRRRSAAASPLE